MRQRVVDRERSGSPAATFLPRPPAPLQRNLFGDRLTYYGSERRHETRVRPEFESSALTPATFSLRRSSALIEGHRVSNQALRRLRVTIRTGEANEDVRPIIDLANVSRTNSIELCRCRRARVGA